MYLFATADYRHLLNSYYLLHSYWDRWKPASGQDLGVGAEENCCYHGERMLWTEVKGSNKDNRRDMVLLYNLVIVSCAYAWHEESI
jgi:hypothetical protein